MDEYLRFENVIFVQVIVMFLDFLLTTCLYYRQFFTFVYLFVITVLQKTIGYQVQCSVFGISHFSSKSNVMLELSYSKYNPPETYFQGGLYMEGVFHFKSWFLNASELIHGEAYTRLKISPAPPPPPPSAIHYERSLTRGYFIA